MCVNLKYAVLSVMGPHAGQNRDEIILRKIKDISNIGKTFWLVRAKAETIRKLCSEAKKHNLDPLCIFIEPAKPGGAKDTKLKDHATEYSSDLSIWEPLPEGLSEVTGNINRSSCALVFDKFIFLKSEIDIWDYADFSQQQRPIIFHKFVSTVCAIGKNTSAHPKRMKGKHVRPLVAIARLIEPYAVWLR